MNLVPPDVAPANSSDDDESIEEESDNVDENEVYDADADKESGFRWQRRQGRRKETRKYLLCECGLRIQQEVDAVAGHLEIL